MKPSMFKDIVRQIKNTRYRYLSIIAIVALGVLFFVGINAASPDMRITADDYFNNQNLYDFNLMSATGFTNDDLDAIRKVTPDIMPAYSLDVIAKSGEKEFAVKTYSIDNMDTGKYTNTNEDKIGVDYFLPKDTMNKYTIIEGSEPKNEDECLVDYDIMNLNGLKIGDKITLSVPETNTGAGLESNTNKTNQTLPSSETTPLKIQDFTIVGTVRDPMYISKDKGSTSLLTGSLSGFILINESVYNMPVYTNVFITIDKSGLSRFDDAYTNKINEVKSQIEGVVKPETYVLTLEQNIGVASYKDDSTKIESIGKVFPVLFFIVAALVSLTAMTRMVDEDRNNIGTYKSLGYGKLAISMKYLVYSVSATVIGSVIGILLGSIIIPRVIINAYKILYVLPGTLTPINLKFSLIAGVAMTLVIVLATMFACIKDLIETPAHLMRPKTPPEGKKIFLEKISFVWKRFNFNQKITYRNIFRYKKRLLMTIIGIAGCTALVYTGFGLRDSIMAIPSKQFGEVMLYDMQADLKSDVDTSGENGLITYLNNNSNIQKSKFVREQSVDLANGSLTKTGVTLITADNLDNFINLRNRTTKEKLELSDDGAIISEKTAKLLGVKVGDSVTIQNGNSNYSIKITGITENYVNHYLYITENTYKKIYGQEVQYNQILIDSANTDNASNYLLQNNQISGVSVVGAMKTTFENMMNSLNYVVVVLIVSAGLLAFVVLFNLNSINIEERKRELATIKVLGFYDKEVASYIYRENIVLTIISAILGLGLGIIMSAYVITTAEIDKVMFYRALNIWSFVYAFVITMVFALVTNLIMNRSIKKIDMIESLKSVE
ncbi:MAG: ABC transporter permease [Oscillospiraceae bacterium]|nr:ABC transporter permease [Oscillospiraceae bacterium]